MVEKLFETASKNKLRVSIPGIGKCSTEDLWDVPLVTLDQYHSSGRRKMRDLSEGSLLKPVGTENEELKLSLDIIEHVVNTRLVEQQEYDDRMNRASRKQEILELIAEKKRDNLRSKSVDELVGLIDQL